MFEGVYDDRYYFAGINSETNCTETNCTFGDQLYKDNEDNKDYSSIIPYDRENPIVMMTASTQNDIAEARNHYEVMVRSKTVSLHVKIYSYVT